VTERTDVWPGGKPVEGQQAERSRTVRAQDIELFTEISGDHNPLHYDAALASRTRFGGIVVQGGITSAILNAVVAEDLPGPGTVFLQVNWSFKAPVHPGDTITGQVVITRCWHEALGSAISWKRPTYRGMLLGLPCRRAAEETIRHEKRRKRWLRSVSTTE